MQFARVAALFLALTAPPVTAEEVYHSIADVQIRGLTPGMSGNDLVARMKEVKECSLVSGRNYIDNGKAVAPWEGEYHCHGAREQIKIRFGYPGDGNGLFHIYYSFVLLNQAALTMNEVVERARSKYPFITTCGAQFGTLGRCHHTEGNAYMEYKWSGAVFNITYEDKRLRALYDQRVREEERSREAKKAKPQF